MSNSCITESTPGTFSSFGTNARSADSISKLDEGRIKGLHRTLFDHIKTRNQQFETARKRKRNREMWNLFRFKALKYHYRRVSQEYRAVEFLHRKIQPFVRTDRVKLPDGSTYIMKSYRYMSQMPESWGVCFAEAVRYFTSEGDIEICRPYWSFYRIWRGGNSPSILQTNSSDTDKAIWNRLHSETTQCPWHYQLMARLFVGPYREKQYEQLLGKLENRPSEVDSAGSAKYSSLDNTNPLSSESTSSSVASSNSEVMVLPWFPIIVGGGLADPLPPVYIQVTQPQGTRSETRSEPRSETRSETGSETRSDTQSVTLSNKWASEKAWVLRSLGIHHKTPRRRNASDLPCESWLAKIRKSKYCHAEACERLGTGWSVFKDHLTLREVYYLNEKRLGGDRFAMSLWEDNETAKGMQLLETIEITTGLLEDSTEVIATLAYVWDTYSGENVLTRFMGCIFEGFEYICKSSVHQISTKNEESQENDFKLLIEIDNEKSEKQTGYKAVKMKDGSLALLRLEIPEEARRTTSPHAAGKIRSDKAIPREIWEVIKVPHEIGKSLSDWENPKEDQKEETQEIDCGETSTEIIDIKLVSSSQTRVVSCVYDKKAGFEYVLNEMAASYYNSSSWSICGEGIHWCPTPRLALEFHCYGQEIANILIENKAD